MVVTTSFLALGTGTPEDREASLRYVLGQGLVDAMTIGTSAPGQLDDNLRAIARTLAA